MRYLHHVLLPHYSDGYRWIISPISGNLIRYKEEIPLHHSIPSKVVDALRYCDNPYLCKPNLTEHHKFNPSLSQNRKLNKMLDIFLKFRNRHFLLSRIYASFSLGLFDNTQSVISSIIKLPFQKEYHYKYCLQRTLLAAKTSNSFKKAGVLFIGSSLPSVRMHAWIIEDGMQPDIDDRYWINFRPLIAFYYN